MHSSFGLGNLPQINEPVDDWLRYIKSKEGKLGDEFELSQLSSGDVLKVITANSEYSFTIVKGRDAILTCPQRGRPQGKVRIMGCTFGRSSSIKPDHLFCGGNLELSYRRNSAPMTHRTTAIREILWRRRRA
ncbi:MAG: hypothetical protein ABR611_04610 [Chthoniobacterales bacterium]